MQDHELATVAADHDHEVAQVSTQDVVVESDLVEDVSIDGMCGVY
ncbi:MAG: mycofactocin precursor [Austwickia sp.]|nr:mycofactocin precursor [Austwickia sp.]MBK8437885.1 mycofactocin precursor [Austwickia sp.]MBK9100186.1 mycofactocin precursor [Austwickia sp.]